MVFLEIKKTSFLLDGEIPDMGLVEIEKRKFCDRFLKIFLGFS